MLGIVNQQQVLRCLNQCITGDAFTARVDQDGGAAIANRLFHRAQLERLEELGHVDAELDEGLDLGDMEPPPEKGAGSSTVGTRLITDVRFESWRATIEGRMC